MSNISVEYIDHMGDDLRVVNAARVSFRKQRTEFDDSLEKGSDRNLIRYLAEHDHFTPFTHPQITMFYSVPIFVARQEFKHVVGFTRNEVSRRYVDDTPEFFVPDSWRSRPDKSIKQGSGDDLNPLSEFIAQEVYDECSEYAIKSYNQLLSLGAAPEQARMVLPQSMMTSYFITGSLYAYARMVKSRTNPHVQAETTELAEKVAAIIKPLFPVSWEYLVELRK